MARHSHLFYFCDPKASFAAGSQGAKTRRLQGAWGDRLGTEAWDLGRRAYEPLRTAAGEEVSVNDLLQFMADEQPIIDRYLENLNELAQAGVVKLLRPDGEPHDLPLNWNDASWTWKVSTTVKTLSGWPSGFEGPPAAMFGAHMLIAALLALDDAVLHSLDDDHEAVAASLLDAAWLVDQVEALERNEREARLLLKRIEKSRASDRAKLRHAKDPKRKAKEFVHECWMDWQRAPGIYPNASAFARAMLDKMPDQLTSEVVISRWVREWRRRVAPDPAQ